MWNPSVHCTVDIQITHLPTGPARRSRQTPSPPPPGTSPWRSRSLRQHSARSSPAYDPLTSWFSEVQACSIGPLSACHVTLAAAVAAACWRPRPWMDIPCLWGSRRGCRTPGRCPRSSPHWPPAKFTHIHDGRFALPICAAPHPHRAGRRVLWQAGQMWPYPHNSGFT